MRGSWRGRSPSPIFDLIERHTTVSVERTVLRWFGVDGVGQLGAPLVNLMVDRLQSAGVLAKGAAYWYGRALKLGARSPLDAVERLTALPTANLQEPLPDADEQALRDEVRAEAGRGGGTSSRRGSTSAMRSRPSSPCRPRRTST